MPETARLTINGRMIEVPGGTSIAAALVNSGETGFRRSVNGDPRGPLCGMGICFECRATVDGHPHRRTCQTMCRAGMEVLTDGTPLSTQATEIERSEPPDGPPRARARDTAFDVLVIGAGPAGLGAAVSAASSGRKVGVVDDNPDLGGQIWRGEGKKPTNAQAAAWLERIHAARLVILGGTRVLAPLGPGLLLAETDGDAVELRFGRLILAPGARELFLPFPGWTLPNVYGAGGLQAMVKSGLPIAKKRVVVAGSGPLLLAVAAYLKRQGANVRRVAEQARFGRIARFGLGLWREPAKLRQALDLSWSLGTIPYNRGCWPVAAEGDDRLTSVVLTDGRSRWRERCDYLACGFGLVPNLELPRTLGCATSRGFVVVDSAQRTSVPGILAAGEVTGIGGLDLALLEGRIAGYAAAGDDLKARELFSARERSRRFAHALDRTFALRDELRSLAEHDTIVCRCEDVSHGALAPHASWLEAKLQTRCGMGPCQGRVCGAAVDFLKGWTPTSVRPPIFPTELGHLASRETGSVATE